MFFISPLLGSSGQGFNVLFWCFVFIMMILPCVCFHVEKESGAFEINRMIIIVFQLQIILCKLMFARLQNFCRDISFNWLAAPYSSEISEAFSSRIDMDEIRLLTFLIKQRQREKKGLELNCQRRCLHSEELVENRLFV